MVKKSIAIMSLLATVCTLQTATAQHKFPAFDTEGHRGSRGLMPENSIPAMKKAVDLGVTTLEMDVVISRDKKVVVSHDAYINSIFSLDPSGKPFTKEDQKKYVIYQMDYAEVKRFDVGSKGNPGFPKQTLIKTYKPLLGELIDSVEQYIKQKGLPPVWYNIETKSEEGHDGELQPAPDEFVALLVAVLKEKKITDRTVIQSFDKRTLQVLHKKHPKIKTSYLIGPDILGLKGNLDALGFKPFAYSPYYKGVTAQLVKECKEQGIKIIPWTANTLEELKALKALGVDGIITDYPDLFKDL
ncbi:MULTISPECIES: glycerophosphodiester phosphodiesterase family protein [Chitinophaga]|uniref:glycerophosphodiester phosphodiesterase family protein n=1 Tax=Chitinophaga TaxID=79328 RepID=UPI000BAEDF1B|nr:MULTISPECIES: glycerophosphodiester phosphodiesterase family protein [Chitinophaga]ASZ11276.1 glycerophosphodiester phosphodiesterase [Chitinophaga sp. MD30]